MRRIRHGEQQRLSRGYTGHFRFGGPMTAYRNVDSEWTLEMKPLIRRQPNSALLQAKCQVILQLDHTRLKLAVSDAMLKSKDCAPFGSKLQLRPGSFDNFIGSDVSARTSFNQGPRGHFVPTDLFQFGSGYALERTMVLHLKMRPSYRKSVSLF